MSFFGKNKSGSGEKLNPFLYIIVAIPLLFIEGGKWCTDKVYSGLAGAFRALFGLIFAGGAAMYAADLVGSHYPSTWKWVGAGIVAFLAVLFYLWPLLYRFGVSPTIDFCEAVSDRVRKYTREKFKGLVDGIVNGISTVCLGSGSAWSKVLTKEHEDTWFGRLIGAVSYVSLLAGSCYLGWQTYVCVAALIAVPIVGFSVAVCAGVLVTGLVGALLGQFIKYGKFAFLGLAIGVAAVWGAAPYVVSLTGATGIWIYAAYAVAYVAFVGYVFPFVNVAFTAGFLEKVWKFLKPLPEKAYDESDDKYSEFFHHVVNLFATGGIGYGTFGIAAGLLPIWGAAAVTAAISLIAYILVFKLINHGGGNFVVGALSSIAAAIFVGIQYHEAGYVYGVYGGIVAGVFTALFNGVVLFPIAYLGSRAVLHTIGLSKLGSPLAALYKFANEQFKKGLEEIRHAYKNCYKDKTGYQDLVLHVTNIAVAVGAFIGTTALLAALLGVNLLNLPLTVLATALSYVLVGKVLFKSNYGLEFLGCALGLAAAVFLGAHVYSSDEGALIKIAGVAAGAATWVGVYYIAFPVGYVLARLITSWALLGWLKPILATVYDWAWSLWIVVWTQVVRAYKGLKTLLTPLWLRIVAAGKVVSQAYRDILKRIRGGN